MRLTSLTSSRQMTSESGKQWSDDDERRCEGQMQETARIIKRRAEIIRTGQASLSTNHFTAEITFQVILRTRVHPANTALHGRDIFHRRLFAAWMAAASGKAKTTVHTPPANAMGPTGSRTDGAAVHGPKATFAVHLRSLNMHTSRSQSSTHGLTIADSEGTRQPLKVPFRQRKGLSSRRRPGGGRGRWQFGNTQGRLE